MKYRLEDLGGSYTFDPANKQVTVSGVQLNLEDLLIITNVTTNDVIYLFNDNTKGATITNDVISLAYDTTAMSSTDILQVYVDKPYAVLDANGKDALGEVADVPTINTLLGRLKSVEDLLDRFKFDPISGFNICTGASHAEIHAGDTWLSAHDFVTNVAGTTYLFLFQSSSTHESHCIFDFFGSDKFYLRIYLNPVITDVGTPINGIGITNAKSSITTGWTANITESPAYSDKGTKIGFFYANKEDVGRSEEIIIEPNDYCLFEVIPDKDYITIGFRFFWYEEAV